MVVVGQGQHVDHDVAALHGLPARPPLPAPPRHVELVAALAILSFAILVLTYLATYIVPGAHSYA